MVRNRKDGTRTGRGGIAQVTHRGLSSLDCCGFGASRSKGHHIEQGVCPMIPHTQHLLKSILHDRVDLGKLMNAKVVSLEDAPAAYAAFDKGEACKYVIDPHGMLR